ncbi:hypothetical protein V1511DRAFT_500307 [Dipodascopsis uninucleata]
MVIERRQNYWPTYGSIWETKWAIVGGIVLGAAFFLVISYFHAKRRIDRGLPPLRYHAWLVNNRSYPRAQPPGNLYREQVTTYPAYPLSTLNTNTADMMPPPPAYDPRYPAPPQYSHGDYKDPSHVSSPDSALLEEERHYGYYQHNDTNVTAAGSGSNVSSSSNSPGDNSAGLQDMTRR